MRLWHATQPGIPILALILSLGAAPIAQLAGAYDLVDEQSLTNGAQLYEVFCSDCHGSDVGNRYDQLYAPDEAGDFDDEYARMIEMVQQEEAAQLIVVPEEDDPWPEWAERPDPEAEEEPDEKAEVINTLTALIDEAHGIRPATPEYSSQDITGELPYEQSVEQGPPGGFEPVPGATNLADPASYFYGTSPEEMFESIAEGTGNAMPGFRTELGGDEAISDVVNYIRSFWSEEWLY